MAEQNQVAKRPSYYDMKAQGGAPSISLAPRNFEELWRFAEMICKTDFVPNGFRANPGAVIAACQYGNEVGLKPMTALRWIAVINGVPSVWGDGALMLLRSHPRFEWIRETEPGDALKNGAGECTIKAKGEEPKTRRFTKQMAEQAGLWGGKGATKEKKEQSTWFLYPGRMLQMRARAWAIRDALPEALGGLSMREEAEDYREPRDITPAQEPPQALTERRPMRQSEYEQTQPAANGQGEEHESESNAADEVEPIAFLNGAQKTAILDALKAAELDEEALSRYLHMNYKVDGLEQLPAEHFDDLVDWVKSHKPQQE